MKSAAELNSIVKATLQYGPHILFDKDKEKNSVKCANTIIHDRDLIFHLRIKRRLGIIEFLKFLEMLVIL